MIVDTSSQRPQARGGAFALGRWLEPTVTAADAPKQRIKIGQIGTGHEHASAKMSTFRKLSDDYEVVGIAESDPELRKRREKDPASFRPPPGRYDLQLIELARIVRGEIENPYPLEHELLVQECLLKACGKLSE